MMIAAPNVPRAPKDTSPIFSLPAFARQFCPALPKRRYYIGTKPFCLVGVLAVMAISFF